MTDRANLDELPELTKFIDRTEAATIAVPVDEDGTIHIASLLYWSPVKPLKFYFVTSRDTEKYKMLETHKAIQCAAVVGTERGTSFTLQMRGILREVEPSKNLEVVEHYYRKRGDRHDDIDDPLNCLLEFSPDWARFIDYSRGYDKHFLEVSSVEQS